MAICSSSTSNRVSERAVLLKGIPSPSREEPEESPAARPLAVTIFHQIHSSGDASASGRITAIVTHRNPYQSHDQSTEQVFALQLSDSSESEESLDLAFVPEKRSFFDYQLFVNEESYTSKVTVLVDELVLSHQSIFRPVKDAVISSLDLRCSLQTGSLETSDVEHFFASHLADLLGVPVDPEEVAEEGIGDLDIEEMEKNAFVIDRIRVKIRKPE